MKNLNYAVIKLGGKQYIVSEGEELIVDKLTKHNSAPQVLLKSFDGKVEIGKPVITGTKIDLKVIKDVEKGEKIRVFKYKAKSRYRKTIGFRPAFTRLRVEKIH